MQSCGPPGIEFETNGLQAVEEGVICEQLTDAKPQMKAVRITKKHR